MKNLENSKIKKKKIKYWKILLESNKNPCKELQLIINDKSKRDAYDFCKKNNISNKICKKITKLLPIFMGFTTTNSVIIHPHNCRIEKIKNQKLKKYLEKNYGSEIKPNIQNLLHILSEFCGHQSDTNKKIKLFVTSTFDEKSITLCFYGPNAFFNKKNIIKKKYVYDFINPSKKDIYNKCCKRIENFLEILLSMNPILKKNKFKIYFDSKKCVEFIKSNFLESKTNRNINLKNKISNQIKFKYCKKNSKYYKYIISSKELINNCSKKEISHLRNS